MSASSIHPAENRSHFNAIGSSRPSVVTRTQVMDGKAQTMGLWLAFVGAGLVSTLIATITLFR